MRKLALLVGVVLFGVGLSFGQRLPSPRSLSITPGWVAETDASGGRLPAHGDTQGAVAGLDKSGSPLRLAILHSWMTSDLMTDNYTTSHYWYDIEHLVLICGIVTSSMSSATVGFTVSDTSGVVVMSNSFTGPLAGPGINEAPLELGMLSPGDYKISLKVKQAERTVQDRFWIRVQKAP